MITSLRRYYLMKIAEARALGDFALELAWTTRHHETPGTDLAAKFPARTRLIAAGYTTNEDVAGASVRELESIGLTRAEARAARGALPTHE